MTYTDFSEKLLIALYQEMEIGEDHERFQSIISKYGLPENVKWLERLCSEWEANGFVDVRSFIGSPLQWGGEISGAGMRYIEQKYGSKDGVGQIIEPTQLNGILLNEDGSALLTEDGGFILLENEDSESNRGEGVDSTLWTGASHVLVDQAAVSRARGHAQELKRLVYDLYIPNNAQSADLKTLVDMLIQALEMCEPEISIIERILASPKLKVGATVIAAVATLRGALGI